MCPAVLTVAHRARSKRSAIMFFMCGRYRLSRRKQILEERFDCPADDLDWVPRYNIAPTQPVPVIRQHPKEPIRKLALMKWGLVPSWAKDPSGGASMITSGQHPVSSHFASRSMRANCSHSPDYGRAGRMQTARG